MRVVFQASNWFKAHTISISKKVCLQLFSQEEEDASDLLDLEALGIAPCPNAPKKDKIIPPKKSPYDMEHGWRVVPRLLIGYVPLKKEKVANLSSLNVAKASEIDEQFDKIIEETAEENEESGENQSGDDSSE